MKRIFWFLAGLISGAGLVLWWGGKEQYSQEYEGLGLERITKSIYSIGDSLADTQPIRTLDN